MSLTIKTEVLKAMTEKAQKCASCNPLVPLTNIMAIHVEGGEVKFITTDATNYMKVCAPILHETPFRASVYIALFSKLVQKLTTESTVIGVEDSVLYVYSDGEYKLEMPLDENGEVVDFNVPSDINMQEHHIAKIDNGLVSTIISSVKPSVAIGDDFGSYANYFVTDVVVGTDSSQASRYEARLLPTNDALISTNLLDMVDTIQSSELLFAHEDNMYIFEQIPTESSPFIVTVYGKEIPGTEDYDFATVNALFDGSFIANCKIAKSALLSALDRIILFVGKYDNNQITLAFDKQKLTISSTSNSGVETLMYKEFTAVDGVDLEDFINFVCIVNADMLKTQIKAQLTDMVELQWGDTSKLKFIDGKHTAILGLEES